MSNLTRIVRLNGIDITDWVISLPKTPLRKPDWGSIPSLKMLDIRVRSDDFAFHPYHPVSLLYGKRYDTIALTVEQYGQLQWSGYLNDVKHEGANKTTSLIGESKLQQALNVSGRLDSTTLTPSEAAQRLLILHEIPVDNASFARATDILNDVPCRVKVNPDVLEWQGTAGDILKMLASAGIGRFYLTSTGAIGFDTFIVDETPTISITITDDELMQWPTSQAKYMDKLVGYKVVYEFDEVSDTDLTKDIISLDFGPTQAVTFTTQGSAVYCGTQWVALSRRDYVDIDFAIEKDFALIVKMGSFITLDSELLGLNRPVEVIGLDNSDPRFLIVNGRFDKAIS